MPVQTISFAAIAKKGLDAVDDGDTLRFEEVAGLRGSLLPWDRNLYAVIGDGDGQFEAGETAHKLGDLSLLGRVEGGAASVSPDDPVVITAHGRLSKGSIGDLTGTLVFRDGAFGLDSGPDGLVRAGYLNAGDSLTFDTRDEPLQKIAFTADLLLPGRSGTSTLLIDLDGDVMRGPNGPAGAATRSQESEHALLALNGIKDGDAVEIDFAAREVRVNSQALSIDASALFDAFEAGAGNQVTIGSRSGRPVALDDLVLETGATTRPRKPLPM